MCGFKPGDEVVCVDASGGAGELLVGVRYIIIRLVMPGEFFQTRSGRYWNASNGVSVWVDGGFDFSGQYGDEPWPGYEPSRFRKVQKRKDSLTLESFLTIKPGQFEEKDAFPVKKKERV